MNDVSPRARAGRRLIATVFAASITGVALGGDVCGPGNPPCDEPHETPGCLQPQCCAIVCENDPFCCEEVWDSFCAEVATELCGDVLCPEEGDCLEVHPTPGCIDESCCELVRLHDPFCGWGIWDALCVEAAVEWCGATFECPIVPPADAIDEGEPCLERVNDGCGQELGAFASMPLDCGTTIFGKITTSVPRDVDWYALPVAAGDVVDVELTTEFPARVVIIEGDCEGPIRVLDRWSVEPCTGAASWSFTAPEGDWHLVVEAGTDGRIVRNGLPCDEIDPDNPPDPDEEPLPRVYGLHYLLGVSCGTACPGDLDGDGQVSGADLGLLFTAWGDCTDACPEDLDGDGRVSGSDLGLLFTAWGACP